MKAFQHLFLSILVAASVLALSGCGVSEEQHGEALTELGRVKAELDKTMAELKKTKADLAQAVSKNTAMEKALTEAQVQIKSESKESAGAMSSVVQDKLAASQKQVNDLQAQVKSLNRENSNLKIMLEKLQAEYAEIKKRLGGGVQVPTQQLPAGLPKKP